MCTGNMPVDNSQVQTRKEAVAFKLVDFNLIAVAAVLCIKIDMDSTLKKLLNPETPLATGTLMDVRQTFCCEGQLF